MKIYNCIPGGKFKALTMSYDDGKLEDRRLVDIFNHNGIRGTFNLNGGKLGYPDTVTAEELNTLYAGHEIATHTLTHPTIARCPMVSVAAEILEDRKRLEAITGSPVRGHAYPNSSSSEEICALFHSLGIAYGRSTGSNRSFALPTDPMLWQPTCHHNDPQLMDLGRRLANNTSKHLLFLMYVWGHSYEFSRNDNWHVIEEFCQKMGGRDDIWYATNIQIVDYVNACRQVIASADGKTLHNPTCIDIWADVDGKRVVIKAGETVKV